MRGSRQALALLALALLLACSNGQPARSPVQLAAQQVLQLAVPADPTSLDPGLVDDSLGVMLDSNVFGGLYRLDTSLSEVPDIADGPPQLSADRLTYTFHLRPDAVFSNGDPVRAGDFLYSWNRVVARQSDWAFLFSVIKGYDEVTSNPSAVMSGLRAVDDRILTVTLKTPAGWFLTVLTSAAAEVVDRKVIEARGEDDWWRTPEGLIGTGPFRLSGRSPGKSYDFVPVPRYWRGSTGLLTRVHVGVEDGPDKAVQKYAQGAYDIMTTGNDPFRPSPQATRKAGVAHDEVLRLTGDTQWVGFNLGRGPFKGLVEGRPGRLAFSTATDRQALASAVCGVVQRCRPATGGLIPPVLRGYAGQDPGARFDPKAARAMYEQWDPDHSKVKGLTYTYESFPPFQAIAENLQAQWKANLGIDVQLRVVDPATYLPSRNRGDYVLFREQWGADYNHPQNWFDLFLGGGPLNHSGYANPRYDALVQAGDAASLGEGLSDYTRAGQILTDDAAYGALLYGESTYLVKPYVRGAGGTAFYDYPWTGVRILQKR